MARASFRVFRLKTNKLSTPARDENDRFTGTGTGTGTGPPAGRPRAPFAVINIIVRYTSYVVDYCPRAAERGSVR